MSINTLIIANKKRNLASKGRFGDTEIRNVDNRPAHVNKTEARVLDKYGPLGDAWVKEYGSGTTNPQTGLIEYFSLWDRERKAIAGMGDTANWWFGDKSWASSLGGGTAWNPNQGKWGIFGGTYASRVADDKKAKTKAQHKNYKDFIIENRDRNIAATQVGFNDDGVPEYLPQGPFKSPPNEYGPAYSQGYGGFDNLMTDAAMGLSTYEKTNYLPRYSDVIRQETELLTDIEGESKSMDIAEDALFETTNLANEGTGANISSGMYGLLTQSNQKQEQQGFAGAGDFGMEFKEKQALEQAERAFKGTSNERENTMAQLKLDREGLKNKATSGIKDIHDEFNNLFFEGLSNWDEVVNA